MTSVISNVDAKCICAKEDFKSDAKFTEIHPEILITQGSLTIFFNVLILLSVVTSQKLRTFPNFLLLSNSIADIFVGVYLFPFTNVRWSVSDCQPISHKYCLFSIAVGFYLVSVTFAHWAAIAMERVLRIFYTELHKNTVKKLLLPTIALCWILPTLPTLARLLVPLAVKEYPYNRAVAAVNDSCRLLAIDSCNCDVCLSHFWASVAMPFQYLVPFVLVTICYSSIIVATFQRIRKRNSLRRELHMENLHPNRLPSTVQIEQFFSSPEFRSIRLFLVLLLVFVLNTLQCLITRFGILLGSDEGKVFTGYELRPVEGFFFWAHSSDTQLSDLIVYLNSLINPVLVLAMGRNFRKSIANLFCICRATRALESPLSSRWNELASRFGRRTK